METNNFEHIEDVIAALDVIVKQCEKTESRAGYFAALYKRMTIAVKEGIASGAFKDGLRMEKLDLIFAGRYLNAFYAYGKKEKCSDSWMYALDGCIESSLTVIQQLLLGINTHINLDLAIAAAQTAPGNTIHELEEDFNRINNVIAELVDDIQACLEKVWFPMRWLKRIVAGKEQDVLNFSISIARKTAWANALLLAGMNEQQQQNHILQMDALVNKVGRRIIHPGFWPSLILKCIRWSEYEDIARTIRLIDTTVVGNK